MFSDAIENIRAISIFVGGTWAANYMNESCVPFRHFFNIKYRSSVSTFADYYFSTIHIKGGRGISGQPRDNPFFPLGITPDVEEREIVEYANNYSSSKNVIHEMMHFLVTIFMLTK